MMPCGLITRIRYTYVHRNSLALPGEVSFVAMGTTSLCQVQH